MGHRTRVARLLVSALITALGGVIAIPTAGGDSHATISIVASPSLYPAYDPDVADYVVRCSGSSPVVISVDSGNGSEVSVDGRSPRTGKFEQAVPLAFGQAFSLTTTSPIGESRHQVRCLPSDFPTWTFSRNSPPTQDWYVVTPSLGPGAARYVIFFDGSGVPVWWYKATTPPLDAKLLSDGNVAFSRYFGGSFGTNVMSSYEVRGFDGSLRRNVAAVGSPTDHHDLQEMGNGNYLLLSYKPRDGVDLRPFGGPANATVVDAEVQEITPAGALVSSWNSKDHITLSETGRWWPEVISTAGVLPDGRTAYDVTHINSVHIDGASMVMSFRHTDGVYRVDRTTGIVQWKLGGTPRAESLTPIGDPHGSNPLGGQHDARILGDGTLSVHDNGTSLGRAPRAVRYRVDTLNRTATLIESITDPEAPASGCCGSAHKLSSSNWLMSWGGTSLVTELAPNGSRVFKLAFGGPISYRAFPIPPGRLSRQTLRDGMTVQNPRSSVRSGGDYDADGKTDLGVFRPPSGTWFVAKSAGGTIVGAFGVEGDVPVPADYDGDGKADLAVFRPASGTWFVAKSGGGTVAGAFGVEGDIPIPADYDGDGKTDLAVFRPASGTWFVAKSAGGEIVGAFGVDGDIPIPADYDGDGKADLAVFRPASGTWFVAKSAGGSIVGAFGLEGDIPVPADYDGDGKADLAVFRPASGTWFVAKSAGGTIVGAFGLDGDIPIPADYDGDGKTDLAVFRPASGTWFIAKSAGGEIAGAFGLDGDIPLPLPAAIATAFF